MRISKAAVLLIVTQVLLVSSIAGKFLYERKVCPRVWTRAAQVNPDSPLRGRYLVLPLRVDACGLPQEGESDYRQEDSHNRAWSAATVTVRDGHLVGRRSADKESNTSGLASKRYALRSRDTFSGTDLYVPDTAKMPSLKPGEELWVEVTVPPAGPPRAIQLAISGNGNFAPIRMN